MLLVLTTFISMCFVCKQYYIYIFFKSYNACKLPFLQIIVMSVNRPSLSSVNSTKYLNLSVTDHSLTITKPDGKTTSSQVGKVAAPAAVAAKVKEAKRDAVDRETLQIVESQLDHVTKGFDAVSVLFQYLVNDVSTKH